MVKEIGNNLLLILVGYFKYLFLSHAIIIGLFFIFFPVVILSNEFIGFGQIVARILEVYGNLFSIQNPDEFVRITFGIISIVFPITGYLISKVFKLTHTDKIITVNRMTFFIFYSILVLADTLIIYLFDERFGIWVFFVLFFISMVAFAVYLLSQVCDHIMSKIVVSDVVVPTMES